MNDIVTTEDRIGAKIDTKVAGQLQVSIGGGGLGFANMGEVMEFAKMMAISDVAVPKHLRRSPGACLGIILQAIEWKMSPFSVANKSYFVNDRIAYEAQLIHAVALQRAPIKGRIKFEFAGEGAKRRCKAWASIQESIIKGGRVFDTAEIVEYTSPPIGEIAVKNSPLWKSDPDQQLTYYSVRALCRRHFPDVLMGIFAPDEFDTNGVAHARDVTPKLSLEQKLDKLAAPNEPRDEINVPEIPAFHRSIEDNDKLAAIVADAASQAQAGSRHFTQWLSALSLPDYARLEKSLPELNKVADSADRRSGAAT
jgi:hypothetical protein